MGIGSIGFTEILVIAVIVLVFFGPQRLPEITRALGGAMREFRRSMNEIQRELEEVDRARKWKTSAEDLAAPMAGATTGSPPHATVPVDTVTPADTVPPAEAEQPEPAPAEEMTGETPADARSAQGELPMGESSDTSEDEKQPAPEPPKAADS